MNSRLPLVFASLFIAIGAVACGDTAELDESDLPPAKIEVGAEQSKTDETKPGLKTEGGFWGDGYHEEDAEEAP